MFQEILTERLLLRSLLTDDAENMFAYRSHPDIIRYQFWQLQSLEEIHTFIGETKTRKFNTSGWHQIGIALRGDSSLIGDVGIHVFESDSRIVEIGITISPDHQSKGFATEALKAILELLFAKLGKHRVTASVDPRNLSSIALMERIGLRKEGHFRESVWFKDSWADDVIFAMLASEWHSRNP